MEFTSFCNLLSDYFDNELDPGICAEIEQVICEDCCCQTLFNTFDKTLKLCKELCCEELDVPEKIQTSLYEYLEIQIKNL